MKSAFVKKYGIEEVDRLVRQHSEQRVSLKEFACKFHTTAATIRRFIKLFMPGFTYSTKSITPNEYTWLINGSIKETSEFITELYINQGKSFKYLVETLNAEKNQMTYFLRMYVPKKIEAIEGKEVNEASKTLDENRYFSIHIVGAKPEALDRLREVA